jgi:hypothetical protein
MPKKCNLEPSKPENKNFTINNEALYHFKGDEILLEKMIQAESVPKAERIKAELEFVEKTEQNAFFTLKASLEGLTFKDLMNMSYNDQCKLIVNKLQTTHIPV